MVAQCVSAGTTAEVKISPGTGRKGLRFRRRALIWYLTPRSGALPFGSWFPALTHWATILRPCRGLAVPAILVRISGTRTLVSRAPAVFIANAGRFPPSLIIGDYWRPARQFPNSRAGFRVYRKEELP